MRIYIDNREDDERILFLKNFAEKNLKEIYLLGQNIVKNLDQQIISSINW